MTDSSSNNWQQKPDLPAISRWRVGGNDLYERTILTGGERDDEYWMTRALELAERSRAMDEVPVGALVVLDGELLGEGWNQPIASSDPTAHAEIIALRAAAARLDNYRLVGTTLYVTIEPCTMCTGALVHARISRLVYGAREPRAGAIVSNGQVLTNTGLNHRFEITEGICREACSEAVSSFFRHRRSSKG